MWRPAWPTRRPSQAAGRCAHPRTTHATAWTPACAVWGRTFSKVRPGDSTGLRMVHRARPALETQSRLAGRSALRWSPAALCAFECTLRHDPQRAVGVHSEHSSVAQHAAQLRSRAHAEHGPAYALSCDLPVRHRLRWASRGAFKAVRDAPTPAPAHARAGQQCRAKRARTARMYKGAERLPEGACTKSADDMYAGP